MSAATPSTRAVGLLPGYQRPIAALAVIAALLVVAWLVTRAIRANRAFHAAAVRAEDEITDIRWKVVGPLPDRDRLAVPLLRFTLPDGSLIETRSDVAAAGPHEVGERVEILYLPERPGRARLNDR
jgi:hypothetical protein